MTAELPKGAFRGLAKIVAPLCFWMAAGWFAYAPMIERIYSSVDEVIDLEEIRMFSLTMGILCIAAGILLAFYGFTGKEPSDAEVKAIGHRQTLCHYCGDEVIPGDVECRKCGNTVTAKRT